MIEFLALSVGETSQGEIQRAERLVRERDRDKGLGPQIWVENLVPHPLLTHPPPRLRVAQVLFYLEATGGASSPDLWTSVSFQKGPSFRIIVSSFSYFIKARLGQGSGQKTLLVFKFALSRCPNPVGQQ